MDQDMKKAVVVFAVLGLLFAAIYVFSAPSPERLTSEFDGTFQAGSADEYLFFSVEPGENLFQFANHDEKLYIDGSVKDLNDGSYLLQPYPEYQDLMEEQTVTLKDHAVRVSVGEKDYAFTKTDNFTLRFNTEDTTE